LVRVTESPELEVRMVFREVDVVEVKEMLRLWVRGHGYKSIARLSQIDRKTVRRYVEAAVRAGMRQAGGETQITDGLVGEVINQVRPARHPNHGQAWSHLEAHREFIKEKLGAGLTLTKIASLLYRHTGVVVPYRTFHRFCAAELGYRPGRAATVRVDDPEPGSEVQVDFGRMGLVYDPATGRRRIAHALIFTAVYSRHLFVFLTFSQALGSLIEGFEAAWSFFGGVFKVVIPDNMKAIVDKADPINARLNEGFLDYAQARGFVVDPTRVRSPQDKPRVERAVPFVRSSFFAGEEFTDLADAQAKAVAWCRIDAGLRIHGTTQRRPAEVFAAEELALLAPEPDRPYDIPVFAEPKVARDYHIEVARALYSVPCAYIGQRVQVRADSALVRVWHRGSLIKTHPRKPPGGRSTDPADYPTDKAAYATRDIEYLKRVCAGHGPNVGTYAKELLAGELPWTKMRQVYRLQGLVRTYGPAPVDAACAKALEVEVVDVTRIARMLERALEGSPASPQPPAGGAVVLRFARSKEDFAPKGGRR
jgi:transposase